MARFVRRPYRRGYSRYYRRSLARWPYRSWRRGSVTRQQQSGRRYFNISFPVENIVSLTVDANKAFSNVLRTCPWYTPVGSADTDAGRAYNACGLPGSIAYRRYCQLYDQVKINSVSFSVSIADTIGSGGIPGVRVYTSWDRDLVNGDALVDADGLINGPESQVITFINNSRAKFYRYNVASDLQERTVFVDSTNEFSANQYWTNAVWYGGVRGTGGYSPSMSLVLQTSNTVSSTRTITLQIQARYNVTFRNPKYGLSVEGSAKGVMPDEDEFKSVEKGGDEVLPDVVDDGKSGVQKFDELTDEQKAKIMELIGSMEDEKGA